MVSRISKSARFSRQAPSIKPTRVAPDVKTTKKSTRVTPTKKATAPPPRPSPVITPVIKPPSPSKVSKSTRVSGARVIIPSRTVTPARTTPIVQPPVIQQTVKRPSPEPNVIVQQPTQVTKTSITQDEKGNIASSTSSTVETPSAVQEVDEKTGPKVPLVPGVPGLIGGVSLVAGTIPFQETKQKSQAEETFFGFKKPEGGAAESRAEALDLSEKVLSEERIEVPTEEVVEIIPGGEPTQETRTFIDPNTGLLTTEVITTTPGDIEVTTQKGGEIVKQQIGQSEVKPDLSDPLGSLVSGVSQSALNEVIGIKNIPAAVTGGEQEELFATPSAILGEGLFSAVGSLGGQIFDLGRQAAGKKKAEAGEQIKTFGIAGDEVTFTQQERGPDAFQILEESGQRATRIAVADPLFAVGDIAVQVPLLVVAPVKAVSVAIKGIGAAGKAVKLASKGVGAVKGKKLLSATGEAVTSPKPKTPLAKTFEQEFLQAEQIKKAQAPQKGQIEQFGSLSKAEQDKLLKSQRSQFEEALSKTQQSPKVKRDLGVGEETAEFAQRRRDASEFAKLPEERISPSQIDPDLQKAIKDLESGGTPSRFSDIPEIIPFDQPIPSKAGVFKRPIATTPLEESTTRLGKEATLTPIDLGKGIGRFLDEGDDLSGLGKGGGAKPPPPPTPPPSGFTGSAFDLGRGAGISRIEPTAGISGFSSESIQLGGGVVKKTPKITNSQIEKLSKTAKIPKDKAEKILRDAGEKGVDSAEFKTVTTPEGLNLINKQVAKQTTALKELEKARAALQKTKSTQKTVSSIADQKTQKKLSDLIKKEKTKAKTSGKSIQAEKATQNALRKLISAEKAKTGTKAISSTEDILFKKPRKLKGLTDDVSEIQIRRPGQVGILGGIATGVAIGSAVGLGLNQEQITQPKVLQNPNLFNKEISRLVKDPTIQIEKTVQKPKTTTVQKPISDTIFDTRQDQRFAITSIFPQEQITRQQQQQSFFQEQQIQQPIQEITTSQIITPPGLPFDFGGIGKDEVADDRPQKRFFRLFDIAKTPFGRVEVGLGAQIQSEKPIFEFDEELDKRGQRREKNLAEAFFDL